MAKVVDRKMLKYIFKAKGIYYFFKVNIYLLKKKFQQLICLFKETWKIKLKI